VTRNNPSATIFSPTEPVTQLTSSPFIMKKRMNKTKLSLWYMWWIVLMTPRRKMVQNGSSGLPVKRVSHEIPKKVMDQFVFMCDGYHKSDEKASLRKTFW
jgi:hypothetical protein